MADDPLAWFENVLGAAASVTGGSENSDMRDARCPQCNASDFIPISDLYFESAGILEEDPTAANTVRVGGMTEMEIVRSFRPPQRKSAARIAVPVVLALGGLSFYIYHRFGDIPGEAAAMASLLIATSVVMTKLRSYSDTHYHARRRWNRTYMCRKCGQLVASSS